jgi:GH25 family lysozyme M1 (1,4-beta-N-acetylmuramidase)
VTAAPVGTVYGPDLSNHNDKIDFAALDALSDVHIATHKITEGIGWTDPDVTSRAPSLRRFAAPGFYHVLWPTNSQDNPQNQAKWFVDEVVRVARWMLAHPCPVLQGDFEIFTNFRPYRAPTISECNSWMSWVAHYWALAGGNAPAILAYAPHWVYGSAVTGLKAPWWASSYVSGSGDYHSLYPGNGSTRWEQVPGHPAAVLQYTDAASYPGAASGVDGNGVRGVSTAADLQALLLGGDMPLTNAEIQAVADRVWAKALSDGGGATTAGERLRRISNRVFALLPAGNADAGAQGVDRNELFEALLDSVTVPRIVNGVPDSTNEAVLGNVLAYIDNRVADTQKQLTDAVTNITAALDALSRQIAAIPTGGPTSFTMTGTLTPEPTQP